MNSNLSQLEPHLIWKNFQALNAVPRPSKKEERVIQFMLDFGKELNLETSQDAIGNVLIKKPATKGMKDRKTVIIQNHLDMVHQKNNDTIFDFEEEGIKMYVDGDWVKADGTTLGADNGLGVATSMAILESNEIEHPAIEAIFTVDEETGMTGAKQLDKTILSGEVLLNMDTEDDDELTIGCAGGVDTTVSINYEPTQVKTHAMSLTVKGLKGGHSGMDINKGLGNANLILAELIGYLESKVSDFKLIEIEGGGLRNAIPREARAVAGAKTLDQVQSLVKAFEETQKAKFSQTEPTLSIQFENLGESEVEALPDDLLSKFLDALLKLPNGVYAMNAEIDDLVETSSNLARVNVKDGTIELLSLQRSSKEAGKREVAAAYKDIFEGIGADVVHSGDYPGWEPIAQSPIVKTMRSLYVDLFGDEPHVMACHAGLECGIIGERYPHLEMVSFGPTIKGAHSPDERASISSVQKFWRWTLETLKNIPKKD